MRFRFLTYNIHKGIGGIDRRYRPERIIETIAHYDPHIVFLQEVDDGVPRSRRDCQVDLLGDALDMRYRAFQRNVHLRKGHYGNAILSKFPLDDVCSINLTVPLKKRRQALAARCHLKVEGHSHSLLLFNFHLGLADYERITQLRKATDLPFAVGFGINTPDQAAAIARVADAAVVGSALVELVREGLDADGRASAGLVTDVLGLVNDLAIGVRGARKTVAALG